MGPINAGPWAGRKCIGCSLVVGPDGAKVAEGPYGVDAETLLYVEVKTVERPARGCGWTEYWSNASVDGGCARCITDRASAVESVDARFGRSDWLLDGEPPTSASVAKGDLNDLDELGAIMSDIDHEHYMRQTIELTANTPDRPFAAVIVDRRSGLIVAEGWNKSSVNPTWHGEIDAINRLAASHKTFDGSQLVLYTTAEPCPMCQGAILWSGIGTVVYGTSIRFLQSLGWRQIDILAEEVVRRSPSWRCTLVGGVLEQECNARFEAASR